MAELTPMRKQYQEIKRQHADCLLFFRLGDFYEMFDEDAVVASRELELALTTRDRGKPEDERTPMCGVPYHSCEAYIGRLIAKGYKVAICDQLEDPKQAKGIVERGVIRIITPGTVTDSSMLEEGRSNYLSAVFLEGDQGGAAFCDVTTGEFCLASFRSGAVGHIINELGRFAPKEAVLNPTAAAESVIADFLRLKLGAMQESGAERFDYLRGAAAMCAQFDVKSVDELGLGDEPAAVCAAGALLSYIHDTQKNGMEHIRAVDVFTAGRFMELDYTTRRNLELTENLRDRDKKDTLLSVLDMTKTPMGGRELRAWISRPLISPMAIRARLAAVAELHSDNVLRGELREKLKRIGDMQRIMGRIIYGTANARDLRSLGQFTCVLPDIVLLLKDAKAPMLRHIHDMETLGRLTETIQNTIDDEPPFSVREGGMIRPGFDEQLDYLRSVRDNGAKMISELEQKERDRTGIKKLKIGYNRVFGYYIDVPRSASQDSLPEEYIRKQTLVSNERYFTQELKELENTLLTAKDRIDDLEYRFFVQVRDEAASQVDRVQATAACVAELDVLCSFAEAAVRNQYCEPEVDMGRALHIVDGRHPVVECAQKSCRFVPNDVHLGEKDDRVAIITGPNMAGKSTYMRQTALIVLMAQMGSFVPAKSASIGVVDRVFTRIGASDDLASGQSTFMVEMNEMAAILKNATNQSLLILDEIGRGTSTYDGMAIARAVLEYCADRKKLGAKTMFATHYHELSSLEGALEGVRNYNISAKKQNGELIFLRKIVPGAADDSYGIEVAKLAGIPEGIIRSAKRYLRQLEAASPAEALPMAELPDEEEQISFTRVSSDNLAEKLKNLQLDAMTPLEAMNTLYQLKKEAETSS
ncbi:MAG: DNA mismatch repair protein MutS [Candidatus Heteroscillospira sp.]|jgi:DNA mismatch repair protein MutS